MRWYSILNRVKVEDEEIYDAVCSELERQRIGIEMIASENYTSRAVMEVCGSVLTNKYSEGYVGKRYYSGNEHIDVCEKLAIDRAKKLFGAEHVNVQPHSGTTANFCVYAALVKLKAKILSMKLKDGGHLSHGSPVSVTGKSYSFFHYGLDSKTETIDMERVRDIARIVKPKIILSGSSAYPRKIDFKHFQEIAEEVDAYHMADIAHIAGLCATGVHENPVKMADVVTTTTHKTLRGPRGAMIMSKIEDRINTTHKKNLAKKIDSSVFPGCQGGPLDQIVAAKAVSFKEALQPDFVDYSKQIVNNAKTLATEFSSEGIKMVSDGTDNHLILLDVKKSFGISGNEAVDSLDSAFIFTNKNVLPNDPGTAFNPSGIRIGTPAVTTRGMKESEMKQIAAWYIKILKNPQNTTIRENVKTEILEMVKDFPLYPNLSYD